MCVCVGKCVCVCVNKMLVQLLMWRRFGKMTVLMLRKVTWRPTVSSHSLALMSYSECNLGLMHKWFQSIRKGGTVEFWVTTYLKWIDSIIFFGTLHSFFCSNWSYLKKAQWELFTYINMDFLLTSNQEAVLGRSFIGQFWELWACVISAS